MKPSESRNGLFQSIWGEHQSVNSGYVNRSILLGFQYSLRHRHMNIRVTRSIRVNHYEVDAINLRTRLIPKVAFDQTIRY